MKLVSIFFSCLILCCFACNEEELVAEVATECPLIANAKILQDDQLPCNYNVVYRFEGKLYTHCVCCLCLKWVPPLNCAGEPLCEVADECWKEFQEKAEYLFSIEEL